MKLTQAHSLSMEDDDEKWGGEISEPDSMYYRQMLIEYAQNNDPEGVKDILFKAKSIPNIYDTKDESGNTVLHHAAFRGNVEICEILIEAGSDIYVMDKVRCEIY